MSSEQSSVNAETVEQTKQQIRGLVGEIAHLSKSDLAPEEYYSAFLQRVVSALAAVGGAVWLLGEGQRPKLFYQINLSDDLMDPASEEANRHVRLLHHVMASREPQLIPPYSGAGEDESAGNPSRFLLVVAPLKSGNQVEGVIEIFQRPDSQPATQRGYLRFLIQMCELANEWIKSRKLQQFSDRHSLWAQADQFARMVHETLDLRETCYTVANEGRRLIGCDRVSVAIKRGKACKVDAVSGQDTIENRSNVVTALGRLATRVVATGESLWYEGSTEDLPPQLEESLEAYVDESYSKNILVLPLRKPDAAAEPMNRAGDPTAVSADDREIIGALIVEQIESELPRAAIEPRVDLVYEHATRAISNSVDHQSVFLMPVWRTIGKSRFLVRAKTLPKTLIVAFILLFIIVMLFGFRKDFNLEAPGTLQPVKRQDVFFEVAGTIDAVYVKDGDEVEANQLLVKLSSPDLQQELLRLEGELNVTRRRMSNLRQTKLTGGLTPAEDARISGEFLQLEIQEQSLEDQLELTRSKIESLEVRSPMAGQVLMAWDAEQSLMHRPVMAGQAVMTIVEPNGEWELELAMPERRMGHITRARDNMGEDLSVSFILATDPGTRQYGTIRDIYRAVQVEGAEEGPTVRILVDIDAADLNDPRPGATVTADVHCGRSSVAYAWFHEAWEWVQGRLLF